MHQTFPWPGLAWPIFIYPLKSLKGFVACACVHIRSSAQRFYGLALVARCARPEKYPLLAKNNDKGRQGQQRIKTRLIGIMSVNSAPFTNAVMQWILFPMIETCIFFVVKQNEIAFQKKILKPIALAIGLPGRIGRKSCA